jgi:hypothetical protein
MQVVRGSPDPKAFCVLFCNSAGFEQAGALQAEATEGDAHSAPGWLISKAPEASPDTVPTAAPICFAKSGPCTTAACGIGGAMVAAGRVDQLAPHNSTHAQTAAPAGFAAGRTCQISTRRVGSTSLVYCCGVQHKMRFQESQVCTLQHRLCAAWCRSCHVLQGSTLNGQCRTAWLVDADMSRLAYSPHIPAAQQQYPRQMAGSKWFGFKQGQG